MSVASQQVTNTRGLHVAISGNSGKGKTHACKTMLTLLPEEYRLTGTVSNKALFYHDALRPGTVLLFDDVTLSEDLQELLKSSTANFREPIEHRTLTTDRQLRVCTIPERCVWWLAKVENVGDDQVMNRMLTVWIDDSKEQDAAVLVHLKTSEEQGPEAGTVSGEVHVCRAIWAVLKDRLVHITIPFATRIQFSNAANRRNPGILFDLIKCHALLRCLQREQVPSVSGELCILATREDFDVAVDLYASLNGATGGQETKLTKNEAAALETVSAMGAEVFTIKQLQQATGLTYYQTYRILHGYASRGTEYAGLLSKCPAVSFVDATVAEDCIGYTVRRREHHFSFDTEVYREWIAGPGIWLTNDCNTAAGLAQDCNTDRKDGERQEGPVTSVPSPVQERRTVQDSKLQQGESTQKPVGMPGRAGSGVCVLPDAVNKRSSPASGPHSPPGGPNSPGSASDTIRKDSGSRPPAAKQGALNPTDYLPLPVIKDEPCHVCGGGPVSSLRRGSGDPPEYLCYTCLKQAKSGKAKGRARSLPGVLDHRAFVRSGVELGKCRICGEGKAVFNSAGDQSSICEECYGRVVREWNKGQGVR